MAYSFSIEVFTKFAFSNKPIEHIHLNIPQKTRLDLDK